MAPPGLQCFSEDGLWKKVVIRRRKDKNEPPEIPDSGDLVETTS